MFIINGILWNLIFVNQNDERLMRSDGLYSLAVTDWNEKGIFVSKNPKDSYLRKIIAHELCHAFCFSFGVHMPMEQEEYLADWISIYGTDLIYLLDDIMVSMKKGE